MASIYIIEGLPGSGKTTFAKRLNDYFVSLGKRVEYYCEGDLHPIDLAWCSITDEVTFNALLKRYNVIKEELLKVTKKVGSDYITAYTHVPLKEDYKDMYQTFEKYEIFKVKDLNTFKQAYIELYKAFSKNISEDTVYIFECVFLQNHINELLLKYGLNEEETMQYFNELLGALSPYKPTLLYINQIDIKQTLDETISKRKTNNPTLYRDWIEYVFEYMETQPYTKVHNYSGYEGFLRYLNHRKKCEIKILKSLDTPHAFFDLKQDYDKVFDVLKAFVHSNNSI